MADSLFGESYVNAGGLIPDLVHGPEAIKVAAAIHHTAFPDLHVTIERLISEGSLVGFQWIARSSAEVVGVANATDIPRGSLKGTTFCRLNSGRIVESWTNWDLGAVERNGAGAFGMHGGNEPRTTRLN